VFVAIGSARSSAVVRHLGTWTLSLGTGLLIVGTAGILCTLHVAGTDLHSYQLIPSLAIAGAGAGLFLAPVTGVIIAGLPQREAGSASGVLATAQQVGAALGIAIVGVLFFGLLGSSASRATADVTPALQQNLAAAHVPAAQRAEIQHGSQTCFADRAHAKDPSSTPASCVVLENRAAAAPAAVRRAVDTAVLTHGLPEARRHDFSRTLQQALGWQLAGFATSFLLVLGLPRVRGGDVATMAAA
jgi:hypothetical protein